MRAGQDDGQGHKLSDGQWHLYEIHLKMDTDGTDGDAHMWVDEELVLTHEDCDFDSRGAFAGFLVGSNQKYPDNGGCEAVDYDDFAVRNTGYIGPLDGFGGGAGEGGGNALGGGGSDGLGGSSVASVGSVATAVRLPAPTKTLRGDAGVGSRQAATPRHGCSWRLPGGSAWFGAGG